MLKARVGERGFFQMEHAQVFQPGDVREVGVGELHAGEVEFREVRHVLERGEDFRVGLFLAEADEGGAPVEAGGDGACVDAELREVVHGFGFSGGGRGAGVGRRVSGERAGGGEEGEEQQADFHEGSRLSVGMGRRVAG